MKSKIVQWIVHVSEYMACPKLYLFFMILIVVLMAQYGGTCENSIFHNLSLLTLNFKETIILINTRAF